MKQSLSFPWVLHLVVVLIISFHLYHIIILFEYNVRVPSFLERRVLLHSLDYNCSLVSFLRMKLLVCLRFIFTHTHILKMPNALWSKSNECILWKKNLSFVHIRHVTGARSCCVEHQYVEWSPTQAPSTIFVPNQCAHQYVERNNRMTKEARMVRYVKCQQIRGDTKINATVKSKDCPALYSMLQGIKDESMD